MTIKSTLVVILRQDWLKAMIRFGFVGLIGVAVDLGILNLLHLKAGWSLFWAVFWGFAVATLVVYGLNNRWTYGHLGLPFRVQTFFKYAIIAAIGLAITEAIIHFLVAEKGLYYNLAKVVAIV
ncbi:MAG: GtrA family protein, partial [Candidatus Berkelbacteria bacterium]|nr:GtrA family protein [Candidatus Berkelbacteria bacterium]